MIFVHVTQNITITWKVFRGLSRNEEDFTRVNLLKVFLWERTHGRRFHVPSNVQDNRITLYIPAGALPPGVYNMDAIWIKNADSFPEHPELNSRCVIRTRKDRAFSITEYEEEATVAKEDTVKLNCETTVATYGYDGLSAYEIAVMRGDFNGSESEWLEYIYGEKKWEERFIFYLKKHIDNNTIYWDEKNKVIKAKGGTPEPDIYILYGNILDEITSFSLITIEMLESSTNHIIKIKPQTLPKTSLGTLQAGSKVVVLIPNGYEYIATKDNGIGGKVPFDESIMGANGQSISLGNNLYKIYGEFMTVSGEIFIYID